MTVVVAPAAAAQIVVRKRWWRANRHKAPERFDGELDAALVKIGERPESFPIFSASGGRTVRRCLLARTRCHLYFARLSEIEVRARSAKSSAAG